MRKAGKRSKDKNFDRSFDKINSPPRILEKKVQYYQAQSPPKDRSAKRYNYIN